MSGSRTTFFESDAAVKQRITEIARYLETIQKK